MAIGAGVAVTVAGAAFVATPCYAYVQATVIDGRTGASTCDAQLVAISGDREERFTSCYYAPLSEGKWQIRASGAGLPDSVTDVEIPEPDKCSRIVHSVVLTLGAMPAPAFQRGAEEPSVAPPIATTPAAPVATTPAPPGATPPAGSAIAPAPPQAAPPAPAAPAADAGSAGGRLPDVPSSPARPPPR